jgi:hypothetical protein
VHHPDCYDDAVLSLSLDDYTVIGI